MEDALKARPEDVHEHYEMPLKALQKACGEAMLELRARKMGRPAGEEGRNMILQIQRGLKDDGISVPITKLCAWFDVPRRTVYYKPVKSPQNIQEQFAVPVKQIIEAEPSFGYRNFAGLLTFIKNTAQRIFQLMHRQVRKRAAGHQPRIEALSSVAVSPNERWATDVCRIGAGRDEWQT